MIDRNESLRDQIATIVQAGYSQRKTSVETADEIIELILKPKKERDVTRICAELMRFLGQQRVEAGRAGDWDMVKHLARMADGVEKALKFYNKCALLPCGDGGNQMTPTPRTDNLSEFGRHYPVAHGSMEQLARDLELENNDLREVLNKLTDSYFLHRCEGMLELMMQADRLRPLDMEGDK